VMQGLGRATRAEEGARGPGRSASLWWRTGAQGGSRGWAGAHGRKKGEGRSDPAIAIYRRSSPSVSLARTPWLLAATKDAMHAVLRLIRAGSCGQG
jgi:hypothetical protein